MKRLSRRTFVRSIAAIPLLFTAEAENDTRKDDGQSISTIPTAIAGYIIPPEERDAVLRFLNAFEEHIAPLRKVTLPGSLDPATRFRLSEMPREKGTP